MNLFLNDYYLASASGPVLFREFGHFLSEGKLKKRTLKIYNFHSKSKSLFPSKSGIESSQKVGNHLLTPQLEKKHMIFKGKNSMRFSEIYSIKI